MHGSDAPELLFGLGGRAAADRVEVLLPDGSTFTQDDVPEGVLVIPWR
jgi:hypothetical protein